MPVELLVAVEVELELELELFELVTLPLELELGLDGLLLVELTLLFDASSPPAPPSPAPPTGSKPGGGVLSAHATKPAAPSGSNNHPKTKPARRFITEQDTLKRGGDG